MQLIKFIKIVVTFTFALSNNLSLAKERDADEVYANFACKFEQASPEVKMMQNYLKEKNAMDKNFKDKLSMGQSVDLKRESYDRSKIASKYVSKEFLNQYGIVDGYQFNTYGSVPEILVCVKNGFNNMIAITMMYNEENDWLNVIKYQIVSEEGKPKIKPVSAPKKKKTNDPLSDPIYLEHHEVIYHWTKANYNLY